MRNTFLLLSFLFVGCVGAIAQNKTLGVGTATPNPNAALHVESPTNNQGFIMPRLTSTQRLSMTLTPSDMGLMVYDITKTNVYTWDGTTWIETGDISYPVVDTVLSAPNNSNLLRIVYAGSAVESVGIAQFSNLNPNNNFNSLFVTNAGTNGAGYFQVTNTASASPGLRSLTSSNTAGAHAFLGRTTGTGGSGGFFEVANVASTSAALFATTTGTGHAGRFTINNASNSGPAVYATTNGAGVNAAAILAETATAFSAITARGTGAAANAVTGIITDPGPGGYAVLGTVSATGGGQAGVFTISNPANANNTLESTTSGTGGGALIKVMNVASTKPALWAETNSNQPLSAPIFGLNTGTGDVAASFRINNAANTFPALYAETNGTGRGVFIRKTNTGGSQPGLFVSTEGGRGIWADHNGATGNAGIFQIINPANTNAALFAEAVGVGPSIWGNKDPGEAGNSIEATHSGTSGYAGNFVVSNAANTSAALNVETNSTSGFGVRSVTTGTEVAGYFQTSNAAANTSTLLGLTNSPTGNGVGAINTAVNGVAFSIFQGGMKISTFEVTTGTTIATRATAYRITAGGPSYTISFTTATGDMFMVYNDTGGAITFEGVSIPSGTGKIVINFNSGSFRGL